MNIQRITALIQALPTISGHEPYDHTKFHDYFSKSDLWKDVKGFQLDDRQRVYRDLMEGSIQYVDHDYYALAEFFQLNVLTIVTLFCNGTIKFSSLTISEASLELVYGARIQDIGINTVQDRLQVLLDMDETEFLKDIERKVQRKFKEEVQPPSLMECVITPIPSIDKEE